MQKPLHLQTTVLPGGKIVIVDQDLADGETVDIFITGSSSAPRRSAVDILAEVPAATFSGPHRMSPTTWNPSGHRGSHNAA